jgi:predicted anti-sigma-YlaC factor YlaD
MTGSNNNCQAEQIAAYLDGDLDAGARVALEEHIQNCQSCVSELNAQRLFMRELEATLASTSDLPVPRDFAQIVAAHAESDMRGVRDRLEHKRALRFCLILALASFALLGVAASKSVIFSGRAITSKILGILGLLWKALYDATIGLTVISRVISRGLLPESHLAGLFALFLVLAVVLLSLLIAGYHRYHATRLIE